jgi:DNA-binding response OmpR family regulator
MDGRTLFREIRSRGFVVPVLILSAYGAESARRELKADAALDKPFDTDVLLESVRSLVTPREGSTR